LAKKLAVLAVVWLGVFAFATSAHAALYDWVNDPSVSQVGLADIGVSPGVDIVKVWAASDADNYYFRFDLEGTPSAANDWAGLYGIYINSGTGGADAGFAGYVPPELNGINEILDSHLSSPMAGGTWTQSDYHDWNGSTFLLTSLPSASPYAAAGQTTGAAPTTMLEWAIDKDELGLNFTWWAATHEDHCEYSHDVEVGIPVVGGDPIPLPASVWLLASGLIGLAKWRRRS
jgi:hypothetical protein